MGLCMFVTLQLKSLFSTVPSSAPTLQYVHVANDKVCIVKIYLALLFHLGFKKAS